MRKDSRFDSPSVSEQTAEWLLEVSEPEFSEDKRRQFMVWLKRSPQHIEEFLAIAALEQELAEQTSVAADILKELSFAYGRSVVPLHGSVSRAPARTASRGRRRLRHAAWASVAGIVLVAFFLFRLAVVEPVETVHRTGLGEQRSIVLSDGSTVTLNTLSEATVRIDDHLRHVLLNTGEAIFDIVEDRERLFVVDTGSVLLSVLGTKFSVYRTSETVRVAVLDGRVTAQSRAEPGQRIVLIDGEGAIIEKDGRMRPDRRMNVEKAVAWTQRRLIFDDARLDDVVSEFNRYNRLKLLVEDNVLAERRITTVVNAHDVNALVGFLQLQPDIDVVYGTDAIRIRTGNR